MRRIAGAGRRGERKQVTVLFAGVKGSMELAEQLDAEEWSSAHLVGDDATGERELREVHRLLTEIGATGHAQRLAKELRL